MTTNEFERDLDDQAGLKRPGRVDMRVFQNTADAGDGHPGVQRCFRNYLHEGGMEKDLQLLGYGIKGTSVDINNVELQQLSNIGATTISGAQWVFVGEADQPLKQASSPTFIGLTLSAGLVTTSTVDGVDVGSHDHSGGANGLAVPFTSLSGDIIYTQLDSIVDTSGVGTASMISVATHQHTDADGSSKIAHVNTTGRTTDDHHNEVHNHGHNSLTGLNDGETYEHITQGQKDLLHAIYTLQSHSYSSHIDINQSLLTTYHPTFAGISVTGIIESATHLDLKAGATFNIQFTCGGQSRWKIWNDGDFKPFEAGIYNIGDATYDVNDIYACNVTDTSCADFSDKTADELYNLFAQIRPRTDGIVHKTKNMTYKHIDFATVPDEFANKADEDFVKENVVKMKTGINPGIGKVLKDNIEMTTISYKKGDTCAIELGVFVYALKDLVVKSYEKIEQLQVEIELLKGA